MNTITSNMTQTHLKSLKQTRESLKERSDTIRNQMLERGLNPWDLMRSETHHLEEVLFDNEYIVAAVSGRTKNMGSALLLMTNLRVIYLNQIPLFTDIDEIGYGTISGVTLDTSKWSAVLTLHTALGDFTIRTFNIRSSRSFANQAIWTTSQSQQPFVNKTITA